MKKVPDRKQQSNRIPAKARSFIAFCRDFSVLRKEGYGGLFMDFVHIFMILGRHFMDDLTYSFLLVKLEMKSLWLKTEKEKML